MDSAVTRQSDAHNGGDALAGSDHPSTERDRTSRSACRRIAEYAQWRAHSACWGVTCRSSGSGAFRRG